MSNLRFFVLLVLVISISAVSGCDDSPATPPSRDEPGALPLPDHDGSGDDGGNIISGDEDDVKEEPVPVIDYVGPKFTLSIEVKESFPEQYAVSWNVTTNTGGWKLTTEKVEREGTLLKIYETLERPGPDEVVTMALVEHEGRLDSDTDEVARAQLYVKLVTRGSNEDAEYKLAAIAP